MTESEHVHPLLGRDAALLMLVSGVLAGGIVGFLHIIDYELANETQRELLSPQLFVWGPAAAAVGFLAGAAHYAWFVHAEPNPHGRQSRRGVWRHIGAPASSFAVALLGFLLVWSTTPDGILRAWSEPLSAAFVAVTLELLTLRMIRVTEMSRTAAPVRHADEPDRKGDR